MDPQRTIDRETVLVTGAAGTVGGYLVRELVATGHRVIATDRPGCRFDFDLGDGAPVEIRAGDITDLGFCLDVTRGADSVIHVAATIDLGLDPAAIQRINVDAVKSLYESARARGCRRFVFFSSASIYKKGTQPIAETDPLAPTTPYERSKADAEAWLWSRPRSATEVVVLRPTMIYGPRARFLGAKLATLPPMFALAGGTVPRIEGGPVCNWAHAADVARAAVFLLDEPRAAWQAYNVGDDVPMAFGDVLAAITRAYGLPVGRTVRYPTRLFARLGPWVANQRRLLSLLSAATQRLWGYVVRRDRLDAAIDASLDRETFLYAAATAIFDTTKLRALGWAPRYPSLADGYDEVLAWFQSHRWLPAFPANESVRAVAVRFAETMAGTWRPVGAEHDAPLSFTVTATAPSASVLATTGLLRLDGVMRAQGLATEQPCSGTLDISVRHARELAYDLAFRGDDGARYTFSGRKHVELAHLLTTMTTLPGKVTASDGKLVGEALLRFDLRHDLVPFLGSFSTAPAREESPKIAESPTVAAPLRAVG